MAAGSRCCLYRNLTTFCHGCRSPRHNWCRPGSVLSDPRQWSGNSFRPGNCRRSAGCRLWEFRFPVRQQGTYVLKSLQHCQPALWPTGSPFRVLVYSGPGGSPQGFRMSGSGYYSPFYSSRWRRYRRQRSDNVGTVSNRQRTFFIFRYDKPEQSASHPISAVHFREKKGRCSLKRLWCYTCCGGLCAGR